MTNEGKVIGVALIVVLVGLVAISIIQGNRITEKTKTIERLEQDLHHTLAKIDTCHTELLESDGELTTIHWLYEQTLDSLHLCLNAPKEIQVDTVVLTAAETGIIWKQHRVMETDSLILRPERVK